MTEYEQGNKQNNMSESRQEIAEVGKQKIKECKEDNKKKKVMINIKKSKMNNGINRKWLDKKK